jgi:hypothetical protein
VLIDLLQHPGDKGQLDLQGLEDRGLSRDNVFDPSPYTLRINTLEP